MSAARKKDSPAVELMELVWAGNAKATSFAWERLNDALRSALHLAICNGMAFGLEDFPMIAKRYRLWYWGGRDGHMLGEGFYRSACITGNMSACLAFEAWKRRPPFIVDGADPRSYSPQGLHLASTRKRGRVAVSFEFPWSGERVRVTSFADDGSHLVACSYKRIGPNEYGSYTDQRLHRYRITPEDIKLDRKARKAAAKASANPQ